MLKIGLDGDNNKVIFGSLEESININIFYRHSFNNVIYNINIITLFNFFFYYSDSGTIKGL
jgi:hypothetical protein